MLRNNARYYDSSKARYYASIIRVNLHSADWPEKLFINSSQCLQGWMKVLQGVLTKHRETPSPCLVGIPVPKECGLRPPWASARFESLWAYPVGDDHVKQLPFLLLIGDQEKLTKGRIFSVFYFFQVLFI
jgi:hypothetical protein